MKNRNEKNRKRPHVKMDVMQSVPKTLSDPGYLEYVKNYVQSLGDPNVGMDDTQHSVRCCYIARDMMAQFELIEGNLKWIIAQNGGDIDEIKKKLNQMLYYYYDFNDRKLHGYQDIKALLYKIYSIFNRVPAMFQDYQIHRMTNGLFVFEFAPFCTKDGSEEEIKHLMERLSRNGYPLISATADIDIQRAMGSQDLHYLSMDDMRHDNENNEYFLEIENHFQNFMEYCVLNGLMDGYRDYIDNGA